MRSWQLSCLVLFLVCITQAGFAAQEGLVVFPLDPLLYAVEKDPAVSVFHANPGLLKEEVSDSTIDMMPLMQSLIDAQEPVVAGIQLRDFDAVQWDLAQYAMHSSSLQSRVSSLDMNGGEISSFLSSTKSQEKTLSEMMNQTLAFDAIKKVAERNENKNNPEVQASVASQGEKIQDTMRTLYKRYAQDHEIVSNTSTKLGFDTSRYTETLTEVEGLVEDIEGKDLPVANPAILQESGMTFYTEPEQAMYREPVQIFGVVSPRGVERKVSILLDTDRFMTTETDLEGNYFTTFTVERIGHGTHTLATATGNLMSEKRLLEVTETGSVTRLAAEPVIVNRSVTGAFCNGSVMANHPVRNAPVKILIDGRESMDLITAEDGSFQTFLPLSPGSHTLRAEFSSDGYPLSSSLSDEVMIRVFAPLISFPDTSSENPFILYGILLLIVLALGGAGVWYIWRSGTDDRQDEFAEEVRIRTEIEEIIRKSELKPPLPGSDEEKAMHTRISDLVKQYWACLTKHGLSESARLAYLTLAGRIATRLSLPSYRTLTPREMSASCSTENYAGIFGRFVGIYEKIRYGSSESVQDRTRFEDELQNADRAVGGEQH